MTTPEHHDPATLGAAQLRLDVAIAQLIQPSTEHIDRSAAAVDPGVRDVDTEHAQHSRDLRRQHARHLAAHRHAQARAVLARLIAHEHRARARRTTQADLPSLLEQLHDAVQSTQGGGGASVGPHRSPIGLAAAELIAAIQRTVRARGTDDLAAALRAWVAQTPHWRTTCPDHLLAMAPVAEAWVTSARTLLNPSRRWTHPGACPNCGQATAHVPSDTGEIVRRPALELDRGTATARCLGCGTTWGPERLSLLAAVLEEQAREQAG